MQFILPSETIAAVPPSEILDGIPTVVSLKAGERLKGATVALEAPFPSCPLSETPQA